MIHLQNKFKIAGLLVISTLVVCVSSCNKDLEQFVASPVVPPSGLALGETIAATASDSLYYRLIVKAGMVATINNKAANYTMFVPDNNGMKIFINAISGGAVPLAAPDAVFAGFIVANLPAASAAGIVSYNTIPQKLTSSQVPTAFPNFQLPSLITLPQPPPVNPFVKLTTFPSAKTQLAYVNNIPVTAIDAVAANGVIHHVFTVVAPPTQVLRDVIGNEPTLSYFRAAVLRADSGSVVKANKDSTNFLNFLLGYGVTNMTILAPNDAAFQNLIYGTAYGYALSQGAPPAVADAQAKGALALGPAIFSAPTFYGILPASSVKGILAYHFLASVISPDTSYKPNIRVFSVNFSSTPGFVKTLINSSSDPLPHAHPGIMVQATFTGPVVTALKFTGLGTFPPGGTPYSGAAATAVSIDKHGVNGVLHIIDKVLLPQ
ncbi:MAG: fasciclin domain-containing protein [Ferruginibacter sp.]